MGLSDNEVNAFLDGHTDHLGDSSAVNDFLDGKTSEFHLPSARGEFVQNLKDAASQVGGTMTGDPSQFAKPVASDNPNPILASLQKLAQPFQGMVGPSRLSATISQPGQIAGQNITGSLNDLNQNLTGTPPSRAALITNKLLGLAGAAALDPQSYGPGAEEVKPITQGLVDSGAKTALNKVIAPAGEILSGVKSRLIKQLFTNPIETITAMSSKDAGAMLGDAYKALNNGAGLTEDEVRLIAKAADRGTGGSQSVYDQVLAKIKANAADPANNAAPTMGELIAARRAASKLSTVRSGSEGYQTVKDLNMFQDSMKALDPQGATNVLSSLADVAQGKTKEAFMNLFPLNKNMSPNALRGSAMIMEPAAAAILGHGSLPAVIGGLGLAALHAPAVVGAGTLAASGAYHAARYLAGNPAVRIGATTGAKSGLQIIRDHLNKR